MSFPFKISMDKWMKKLDVDAEKAVAKVMIVAYQGVTTKTPVDEGTARNNWNLSPLKPRLTTHKKVNPSHDQKQLAKVESMATVAIKFGGDLYLSNNLPYIRRLEYGHSKKSKGMVRRTIQDLRLVFQ